ncbi:MAG: DMT family protein [Muribaculaceae bacterium]|nr:DMT family protein [Muribaculaceae bacterium]
MLGSGLLTIGMLITSNVLMTFAWYGHLKLQNMGVSTHWPLIAVILFSWGIALFEYMLAVPANRIGYVENGGPFTLIQLKITQEVISLVVFSVIVTLLFKGESFHWNHLMSFLLLIGAVYFAFLKVK